MAHDEFQVAISRGCIDVVESLVQRGGGKGDGGGLDYISRGIGGYLWQSGDYWFTYGSLQDRASGHERERCPCGR